jgi:osmotically-inducible protein OsmY
MSRRIRRSLGLVAVLAVAVFVSACTTTQSPGTQVDDNTIHAKIKAKLTAERFSNIVNVDINVTNGIVTLAGEVPNEKVKMDAEAEARSVEGVKQVINNLQVKYPSKP